MYRLRGTIVILGRLLALVAASLVVSLAAVAEPRIALVIGNAKYQAGSLPPLANPVNDAILMDETLKGLGFEVLRHTNATEDEMEKAIREFGIKLKAAGPTAVGLFYYSGHGVQSDGNNYMVPVDADVQTIEDVESEAPRMGLVIRQMNLAGNAANFIILDACRNNTLPSENRDTERGLTPMPVGGATNLFIAYATQPGTVAADGQGANSPYTSALARLMKSETAPAVNMFMRVSAAVRDATSNRQQPWTENGLPNDAFCFGACSAAPVKDCSQAPSPAQLFFKPDEAMVSAEHAPAIGGLIKRVLESGCEVKSIAVQAYADGKTQPEAAKALAERRGRSVADALIAQGMPANLVAVDARVITDEGGPRIQQVQRYTEVWVAYKSDVVRIDTLERILAQGMIFITGAGTRLDVKFTPDGKFSTSRGQEGSWRADVASLCLTLDGLLDNACSAYPAGKTSGDQIELPGGAGRVTIK